jgi:hypothetical protein
MSEPRGEHDDVRFEKEDVKEPSVFWFGVWILAVMVAVAFAVKPLFDYLGKREEETQPPAANVLPLEPGSLEPPAPRLQVTPRIDLRTLRAREDRILTSYAWVDKERGIARIPVEEAMRIVATNGLPRFPAVSAATKDAKNAKNAKKKTKKGSP